MRRLPLFLLVAASAAGCNSCNHGPQSAPRGAAAARPVKPAPPVAPEKPPPPPPPAPLAPESALQALLAHWLEAQNKGDFAGYSALYASKFQGVKRAGTRLSRMNRAEWLKDRERMFQKPMTVTAAEPEYDIRERAATVTFTQTWESGAFKDQGPKRLLIVSEGDQLHIAREELLSSTVLRSQKQQAALGGFAFVVDLGGPRAMVGAATGPAPQHGPLEQLTIKDGYAVEASITGAPPPELAAYEGKAVQLTMTNGAPCRAKLADAHYVVQVVPHFGEVEMWQEAAAKGQTIDVASEVWDMAWHKNLALRVKLDEPAVCRGQALFLQDADAAPPQTAVKAEQVPREPDVLAAFRQLKSYAAMQAAYEAERGKPPAPGADPAARWDSTAVTKLDAFRFADASDTIVALRINPNVGCGVEDPSTWAVFAVPDDAKKAPRMIKDLNDDVPGEIVLVLDLERDGTLEYVVRDLLKTSWSLVTSNHEVLVTWALDYQDCPC